MILEKIGKYCQSPKMFGNIHQDYFDLISKTQFSLYKEINQKLRKFDKQKDYLENQSNLKEKGKLSKKKIQKLEEKQKIHEL